MVDLPDISEVRGAAERIRAAVVRTPLVPLHSYGLGQDIHLKLETLQPIKSFKIRGVYNAVATLSPEQRRLGLSTHSSGNTAQALGLSALHFSVTARSVIPENTPTSKVEAIRSYGVEPVFLSVEEHRRYMYERGWEDEPFTFIDPWANRALMAGHGTIGLEILEDLEGINTIYIPVGGGGLICGVGSVLKSLQPSVRVVGVEPETVPSLFTSFKRGEPSWVEPRETICDGVDLPFITEEMFPLLQEVVDEVALVSEKSVKKAIKRLVLRDKVVVEGAGALPVAAAMAASAEERGKAVCIVSGGNVDLRRLLEILRDPSLD